METDNNLFKEVKNLTYKEHDNNNLNTYQSQKSLADLQELLRMGEEG